MSKKQKRLVYYSSPLLALLVLSLAVRAKLNAIEASAQTLAQMGQAAQKVLGDYREGVERADASKVLSCYADAYASEGEGFWSEELQSERDGVRVYEWNQRDVKPFGKGDVGEQVGRYLSGLGRVEESKLQRDSVERLISPHAYGHAGTSAVDYDNDGWYDIFFADGERPRLYRNDGDGTFTDVTAQAGLPDRMPGVNVGIFADFDNDGYKDLFLGCFTDRSRLFRNVADPQDPSRRKFVEVTDASGITKKGDGDFVVVAAAGDYNNDGLLDIYVGRYLDPRKNLPTTLFYTRNGEGNSLLRNDGHLHFTDVTRQAHINETSLTLGVAWADYDGDGWQDVYVANDFGRDALLHNNGDGTFTDVSKETGAFDPGYGMSATWGDIDNDGHLDIYVSD